MGASSLNFRCCGKVARVAFGRKRRSNGRRGGKERKSPISSSSSSSPLSILLFRSLLNAGKEAKDEFPPFGGEREKERKPRRVWVGFLLFSSSSLCLACAKALPSSLHCEVRLKPRAGCRCVFAPLPSVQVVPDRCMGRRRERKKVGNSSLAEGRSKKGGKKKNTAWNHRLHGWCTAACFEYS